MTFPLVYFQVRRNKAYGYLPPPELVNGLTEYSGKMSLGSEHCTDATMSACMTSIRSPEAACLRLIVHRGQSFTALIYMTENRSSQKLTVKIMKF